MLRNHKDLCGVDLLMELCTSGLFARSRQHSCLLWNSKIQSSRPSSLEGRFISVSLVLSLSGNSTKLQPEFKLAQKGIFSPFRGTMKLLEFTSDFS